MTDYSIPNGDLKEVAEAFERITRGEVVAFRTVDARGKEGMQMVRGDLRKSSAYVALPVRDYEEGWALRKLARAEIDKQIHDAEAGIAYLKGQREKLDKAGADAYEVFLRQPWPRRAHHE